MMTRLHIYTISYFWVFGCGELQRLYKLWGSSPSGVTSQFIISPVHTAAVALNFLGKTIYITMKNTHKMYLLHLIHLWGAIGICAAPEEQLGVQGFKDISSGSVTRNRTRNLLTLKQLFYHLSPLPLKVINRVPKARSEPGTCRSSV